MALILQQLRLGFHSQHSSHTIDLQLHKTRNLPLNEIKLNPIQSPLKLKYTTLNNPPTLTLIQPVFNHISSTEEKQNSFEERIYQTYGYIQNPNTQLFLGVCNTNSSHPYPSPYVHPIYSHNDPIDDVPVTLYPTPVHSPLHLSRSNAHMILYSHWRDRLHPTLYTLVEIPQYSPLPMEGIHPLLYFTPPPTPCQQR